MSGLYAVLACPARAPDLQLLPGDGHLGPVPVLSALTVLNTCGPSDPDDRLRGSMFGLWLFSDLLKWSSELPFMPWSYGGTPSLTATAPPLSRYLPYPARFPMHSVHDLTRMHALICRLLILAHIESGLSTDGSCCWRRSASPTQFGRHTGRRP
jgi:hypothetical protein